MILKKLICEVRISIHIEKIQFYRCFEERKPKGLKNSPILFQTLGPTYLILNFP